MKPPAHPDSVPDAPDIEAVLLRTLVWQPVPPRALQRALDAALAARALAAPPPVLAGRSWRTRLTIPRGLRWPLAACWAASLALRLSTPDSAPAASPQVAVNAQESTDFLAILESNRRQTHALLLDLPAAALR